MRTSLLSLVLVALAAMLAFPPSCEAAEGSVTLKGTFTNQGKTYELKGVFTPDADGKWKATWTFTFGRRGAQVFKGTVEGKPGEGEMKGKVKERRLFVFEGTWKDGLFKGKTAEYFKPDGKASSTGTMELKVEK